MVHTGQRSQREVRERAKREQEGIDQIQRALEGWHRNRSALFSSLLGGNQKPEAQDIFGLVVMEGFWGSPQMIDANLPVVERSYFEDCIRTSQNLEHLRERVYSFDFVPVEGKDWKRDEFEVKFGQDRVCIDGFQLAPFDGE